MPERFKFDRMELAGSLGDLGTLLPIAIAMVLFNGLNPVGLFLSSGIITLLLLDSRKFPAGLVVVGGGLITGLALGAKLDLSSGGIGIYIPQMVPFGFPEKADFTFALFSLVLPQLPMTLGNAVLAYTNLSWEYFGNRSAKVTNRKVCVSMALANFFSFLLGGMPLCHGAGGLAAHYRFGARTAGSNVLIGMLFLAMAVLLGENIVGVLNLLPMSILGVLLAFAGSQLTLTIMDMSNRKDYFVATLILGITLASNLAAGFIAGIVVAHLLNWDKLSV